MELIDDILGLVTGEILCLVSHTLTTKLNVVYMCYANLSYYTFALESKNRSPRIHIFSLMLKCNYKSRSRNINIVWNCFVLSTAERCLCMCFANLSYDAVALKSSFIIINVKRSHESFRKEAELGCFHKLYINY